MRINFYLFVGILFLTFLDLFASPRSSFALTQYRCAGLIQYRPCNDDRAIPALVAQRESFQSAVRMNAALSVHAQMKIDVIPPTVFSTKYQYNSVKAVGVWTGFVHGEGPVILSLRLNIPGAPPEVRYMGKAVLRGKTSPFEFHSTPPKGSHWNWHISAKNEANF